MVFSGLLGMIRNCFSYCLSLFFIKKSFLAFKARNINRSNFIEGGACPKIRDEDHLM
jgi:hypothetical protein